MDEAAVLSVAPEVKALVAGVEGLSVLDPGDMADAELSDTLRALHSLVNRIEAAEARLVGAWDARKVWVDDDARSGGAWLAHRLRIPKGEAMGRVRFARRLRQMPLTEKALVEGSIGVPHAKRLAHACSRAPKAFAADEEKLVGWAQEFAFSAFDRGLTYWVHLADAAAAEDDAHDGETKRSLHLSQTFQGNWVLDGTADPVRGAVIADTLLRLEDELFEADWAEAKARVGDAVSVSDLARTPAQRRLDALVLMAIRSRTAPSDGTAPAPLFSVLVDYETTFGRICELANGTVVTPGQLAPWISGADVERIVFGPGSRVLDVGRRQRLFRGATRRAVEVRDRHCQGFGCDVPADRCEVDHVELYDAGGLTVQENGRLECPFHHRRRHRRMKPPPNGPP